jgi:hypothetical protein
MRYYVRLACDKIESALDAATRRAVPQAIKQAAAGGPIVSKPWQSIVDMFEGGELDSLEELKSILSGSLDKCRAGIDFASVCCGSESNTQMYSKKERKRRITLGVVPPEDPERPDPKSPIHVCIDVLCDPVKGLANNPEDDIVDLLIHEISHFGGSSDRKTVTRNGELRQNILQAEKLERIVQTLSKR